VRLGLFDHFGWAVAVTASADHEVVDRRRIELVEPGVTPAPIHYDGPGLDENGCARLVADVRASVRRAATAAFAELERDLPAPIESLSLRTWPDDFPTELSVLLRAPYESRADAVMYRQELAAVAHARGWRLHRFDARRVEERAAAVLGDRADDVLRDPRRRLGPPWTKDHRVALAATVVAG
jgi:hypothetical protein